MTETGAGRLHHGQPRAAPRRHELLRPRRGRSSRCRIVDDAGPRRAGTDVRASCWCAPAGADPRRDFFTGYLKDEAATEEAWAGGWFHTGDVVRRDADGQLLFRRPQEERDPPQRREHLGGRGRERAQPASGGAELAPSPPTPDAVRGDEVLACIVPRDAVPRGRARRRSRPASSQHALAQLAYYKAPGYVAFVDALPLTRLAEDPARRSCASWRARLPGAAYCIDTRAMKKTASHDDARSADVLRRRGGRRAGDGAVRALLDARRALVHRPGAAGAGRAVGHRQGRRSTASRVSSFSLAPDTAVGVTQHLGLSPRWLDHIPTGGASRRDGAAPRRARGAGRRRRRRRLRRGRHEPRRLVPPDARRLQQLRARRQLSRTARAARTRSSRSSPRTTCAPTARRARTSAASRRPARQRAAEPERAVQEAADARRSTWPRGRSPTRSTCSTA